MNELFLRLKQANLSFLLNNFSSLDRYFNMPEYGDVYVMTDGTLTSLAKLFETLEFPGLPLVDATAVFNHRRYVFRCVDKLEGNADLNQSDSFGPFTVQQLLYNPMTESFSHTSSHTMILPVISR